MAKKRRSLQIYIFAAISVLLVAGLLFWALQPQTTTYTFPSSSTTWWDFQAVDTMKYSRDLAGEMLNNPSFDKTIDQQVKDIADIGATHVAIATPYDKQFLPYLKRWVQAARKYKLKVWFRGNFSGWEKWFGYDRITREQHLSLTREFILENKDLFENGDYFTACPECENGGPGNPFSTGDFDGHKKFLIDSYNVANEAFKQAGKNVRVNLNSMNGDIAKRVMSESTTAKVGGVVTVDHYVADPSQLDGDINDFSKKAQSPVILGEYGAPIPDLHGNLTEKQQAEWIDKSLGILVKNPNLIGISYWTNVGGSTQLWQEDGTRRMAADTLKKYFKPKIETVIIKDELGIGISGVRVVTTYKRTSTNSNGQATIPVLGDEELYITKDGYSTVNKTDDHEGNIIVTMRPTGLSLPYRLRLLLRSPFNL